MNKSNTDQLYSNVLQLIHNNTFFTFDGNADIESMSKGQIGKFIYQIINKVSDYIDNNLSLENKFMLIYDYDHAEEHVQSHKDFIAAFNNFKFEYTSYGSSKLLATQLKLLMDSWQKTHIVTDDKHLCHFLGKRVWNDSMKTEIESVDKEHTALFSILNNLLIQIEYTPDKHEILKTFKFFITYVDKHFSNEEAMMEQYHYPDIENHKTIHKNLTDMVYQLYHVLQEEELDDSLKLDLKALASDWLVDHVLNTDMAFAQFINDQ